MGSKVSIIMPLYNAEKYVSKTIQSFVQQSYKDKELVIVDDCSTDGSYDVAVRYSRLYDEPTSCMRNMYLSGVAVQLLGHRFLLV